MKREQIRDYKAGQQITTGRINQLVRAARRDVSGQPPIVVQAVGNSWQIIHTPHKWDWFPAKIQSRSSDFSDSRYWARPVVITNNDAEASDVLTWSDAGTVPADLDVVAVNLAESGDHRLSTSDTVVVFRQEDDASPTNYRHFMAHPPTGFWAELTDRNTSTGYYSWARLKANAEANISPAVTGSDNAWDVNEVEGPYSDDSAGTIVWMTSAGIGEEEEYRFMVLPKAVLRYQVIAANGSDLKFKPDWVRAH